MHTKKQILKMIVFGIPILLIIQGCKIPLIILDRDGNPIDPSQLQEPLSPDDDSAPDTDSDTYGGKTYAVADREMECSQEPTTVKELIEERDDGFYLVRENCEDLDNAKPLEMSDLEIATHNPGIVLHKGRAFFAYDPDAGDEIPEYETVFCRDQQTGSELRLTMDVYFSKRGSSAYSKALIGVAVRKNDGSYIDLEAVDLPEKKAVYQPLLSSQNSKTYLYGDHFDIFTDSYLLDISRGDNGDPEVSVDLDFAWETDEDRIVDEKSYRFRSMACQIL